MNVLARTRARRREIDCGIAATREERAVIEAQSFRVDQRRGSYGPRVKSSNELRLPRESESAHSHPDAGADHGA